ncbi:MAG: hypothetical protein ACD_39C00905G0002 [uncultured bacterium]|nr:MAG: hypothetical protein ACD_39C00905G0002 [uncultured bacterium]
MTGKGFDLVYNTDKNVIFEVIIFALHDRGKAFKTHASINVLAFKRSERAIFGAVILGKHQIPEFEKTCTIATRCAIRTFTANLGTLVYINF